MIGPKVTKVDLKIYNPLLISYFCRVEILNEWKNQEIAN